MTGVLGHPKMIFTTKMSIGISKNTHLQYVSLIPTKAAVHTDYAQAFKSLVNCAAIPGGYEFAWKRETNSFTLSFAKDWAQ